MDTLFEFLSWLFFLFSLGLLSAGLTLLGLKAFLWLHDRIRWAQWWSR
jgi:hypothetical protein